MLHKRFIQAAKAIVSKDPHRRVLNYLRIEGGAAVATNGHAMVVQKTDDPEGWVDPKLLTAKDALLSKRTAGPVGLDIVQGPASTQHFEQDGPFPKWRDIIPKNWGGCLDKDGEPMVDALGGHCLVGAFDAKYLIDVLKAFEQGPGNPVRIYCNIVPPENKKIPVTMNPLMLQSKDADRFAVVMPCKLT